MKKMLSLALLLLLIAACSPQPLPDAPTPIRTLYPATLPAYNTQPPVEGTQQAGTEGTPPPGQTAEPGGGGDAVVQAGEQVFQTSCSPCHNLTTETKVGPGLAGLFTQDQLPNGNPVTDENLREWITNGGGAMPPVPLPEDDLTAVIAFLHVGTEQ